LFIDVYSVCQVGSFLATKWHLFLAGFFARFGSFAVNFAQKNLCRMGAFGRGLNLNFKENTKP
jgi:hypothetical protein